jgi:hypothetical protein
MTLLDVLLAVLVLMPFASAAGTIFFVRLVKEAIQPPILLVMLTGSAIVNVLCGSYLAGLTLNARLLGNTNPAGLAPVTVFVLIAALAPSPLIALVLWRVSRGVGRGRLTRDVPDKAQPL